MRMPQTSSLRTLRIRAKWTSSPGMMKVPPAGGGAGTDVAAVEAAGWSFPELKNPPVEQHSRGELQPPAVPQEDGVGAQPAALVGQIHRDGERVQLYIAHEPFDPAPDRVDG